MSKFFFIKHKITRWILGDDDKFSVYNVMRNEAQKFDSEINAENKAKELNLNEFIIITASNDMDRVKRVEKDV